MAIHHRETGALGVQFHPESILTSYGKQMLHNFLGTFMSTGELTVAHLPMGRDVAGAYTA